MVAWNGNANFAASGALAASSVLSLKATVTFLAAGRLNVNPVIANRSEMDGAGSLRATVTFMGIGGFAKFTNSSSLSVGPLSGNLSAIATCAGSGHLCIKTQVILGSMGRTTNRTVRGPGSVNNVVV